MSTFTDFKTDFYGRFTDPAVFDCAEFNLLKVVLDGLKVRYAERGPVNTRMFGARFLFNLKLLRDRKRLQADHAKRWKIFQTHVKHQSVWGIDYTGRGVSDGKGGLVSLYYDRIRTKFPTDDFVILNDRPGQTPYLHGIDLSQLVAGFAAQALDAADWNLRNELVRAEQRFFAAGLIRAEERLSVRAAFQKFFDEYRGWKNLVQHVKPKVAFFTMHYHREGFLLALKRAGVRSVELQHGLIAEEDIFYVMPPMIRAVRDRALYADALLVYGQFWKNRLLKGGEYGERETGVVGWYPRVAIAHDSEAVQQVRAFIGNKKCVLVCTQTSLHEDYKPLIAALAETLQRDKEDAVILVKPHPHETVALYQELERFSNVRVVQGPLDDFFALAQVHASIYSTTHYDAQRHGLRSFAWSVPNCADYVQAVVNSGVAESLARGENIFSRMQVPPTAQIPPASAFYADFDSCWEHVLPLIVGESHKN